ncbi:Spo0E family sporulation regulatory protein-aspartic acid phosphatase [Clostridium sp. BJN0013]|uniref:Spo0E family sporulation regulatory protein-aspartic acid phosphatase n=1 Tax=Clostridium sp. BJN0013 TaxID=3236840 RepID=UPI0034C6CBAC
MPEIEKLLKNIEILRKQLEDVIDKKQSNLIDEEVISMSKILDATLNQYNEILAEKLKK